MRKDIRLYIADKRVDIPDGISLPITYQTEDFNNPTIVKNSFSKTIAIPGTKNNNNIFGEIYKLDRMQHYDSTVSPNGIYFDPSKRTDFAIYKDGELMESGYMQLNDISVEGENITYNITLYGGIGDFFYGLKYNEDGTTKTLADLRFFVEDNNGNVLPEDEEMDFIINKDFVHDCFNNICTENGRKLRDFMTFVPAYNGLYEDFDTSKCLVNAAWLDTSAFPTSITEDNVTYSAINGLGMCSLEKDYTEWEIGDLRSYKQRPALKMNRLIETICREENSGYNVTFDPSFFNTDNPYWSRTYLALPLLSADQIADQSYNLTNVSQYDTSSYRFGKIGSTNVYESNGIVKIEGQNITPDSDGYYNISAPAGSKINLSVDFQLFANVPGATDDMLYQEYHYSEGGANYIAWDMLMCCLSIVDENGNEIGYSNAYQFEDAPVIFQGEGQLIIPTDNGASVTPVDGNFVKNGNRYNFVSDAGGNTWRLMVNDCSLPSKVKILLQTFMVEYQFGSWRTSRGYLSNYYNTDHYRYDGYSAIQSASGSVTSGDTVASNMKITKELFLKTEKTPADFLLDYTKMFGLYFIKDVDSKNITILSRNNFFTGNVVNFDDKIDYSKNVTVTPIIFDKKYYSMILNTPETKYSGRYKAQYSQEYGQQRMATGYNFNYETNNLYKDNIYQSIVPALHSDKYFRNFYDRSGNEIPCFVNDNCTYTLYNGTDEHEIDVYGAQTVDPTRTVEWNNAGKDYWPKSCFFKLDGNDESLQEISYALLLYNGRQYLSDSTHHNKPVWVTDDLPIMYQLNDAPCYIYTNSQYDGTNTNIIAKPLNVLPQFINCLYNGSNNITASLDFGVPKEIYIGNFAYQEPATIYYKFWRNFYLDQFNIDTKKVTCFVKLDYMNQERLRDFYYFDNAIWVLNKVDSYDVCSDNTVRCEFIKVQNVNNYTSGQITY